MLNAYLCSPHMHFNNLVLISPEGLPLTAPSSLPSSLSYPPEYMNKISLATSCNIVNAKMTVQTVETIVAAPFSNTKYERQYFTHFYDYR